MTNNGGWYTWSKTAAQNATADQTVNWQAGMSPSSISPSGRAMMSSVAKGLADISGSLVTTGTSTAYQIESNQQFDTLTDFNGQMIAFTPHTTNGAGPVTMTVDGFANLPLRSSPNVELQAGTIIQGTPYVAIFNNTDNSLYLQNFYGNPFNIPLAGGMPYFAPTPPNSAFAFPFGQAISRTTYATLFNGVNGIPGIGTTYGAGDGVTTFNLPDLRGRGLFFLDSMGGTAAGRMTAVNGFDGTILGNGGGSQTETITLAQLPTGITSSNTSAIAGTITGTATSTDIGQVNNVPATDAEFPTNSTQTNENPVTMTVSGTASIPIGNANVISNNTGGQALPIIPPALMCNLIMRII